MLESHQLRFVSPPVIFPAECDLVVLEAEQTVIGYGDPVGIAAEVVQNLIRAAEGRFRVDDPFELATGSDQGLEGFRIGQGLKGAMEPELAGGVSRFEIVEEPAAEEAGENAHGQEEAVATGNPAAAVE
jgi:hypothetical protein